MQILALLGAATVVFATLFVLLQFNHTWNSCQSHQTTNAQGSQHDPFSDVSDLTTVQPASLPPSTKPRSVFQQPKVAFLFLIKTHFPLEKVWDAFFPEKLNSFYSIYFHTKPGEKVKILDRFKPFMIPSVPTEWGSNLFDSQLQLLLYALSDPLNVRFFFISDTTIPLKPLQFIYTTVMALPGSSFCICPRSQSMTTYNHVKTKLSRLFVNERTWRKAEMWSVINRKHAQFFHESVMHLREIMRVSAPIDQMVIAPDEYAFVSLMYKEGLQYEINNFSSINDDNEIHEGMCHTYVFWADFAPHHGFHRACPALANCGQEVGDGAWQRKAEATLAANRSASVVSSVLAQITPPLCVSFNPFYFTRISETHLEQLMSGPLLMARKFHEYGKVVLTSTKCGKVSQAMNIQDYLICALAAKTRKLT